MGFTYAVIADSHFHPPGEPFQAAWAADGEFNARNEAVVRLLRDAPIDLVVHLGDVPHPVPGLAAHDEAVEVAQDLYASLPCPVYVVPGNHDIGDKPNPTSPVPPGGEALRERFVKRWGPCYQSFDHGGWRFVIVDTPLMNTGTPAEDAQWAWLEAVVDDSTPWFAFLHYPPFLLHRDEPEHYDNLGEPARSRLLACLARARATFCGHVHHPFWHPLGPRSDLHLVPSTAFVRPGYSEASAIGPGAAFGRDDVEKLGLVFVHVDGDRVELEHVPTHPRPSGVGSLRPGHRAAPRHPLGATLRHRWDETFTVPADGLDPFTRKEARNDLALRALTRAGFHRIRVPVDDLERPTTRRRAEALVQRGWRVAPFGTRLPPETVDWVETPELVRPEGEAPRHGRVRWSVVRRAAIRDDERFSHFPALGFLPEDERPEGAVVRCPPGRRPLDMPADTLVLVELPRNQEGEAFVDPAAVARRGCEALVAAVARPELNLFLDTFVDHDRGYYPREAFVDRRGNPHAAHRCLVHLNRLLPRPCQVQLHRDEGGDRYEIDGAGSLWLPRGELPLPPGIDLARGEAVPAERSAWPRWVDDGSVAAAR